MPVLWAMAAADRRSSSSPNAAGPAVLGCLRQQSELRSPGDALRHSLSWECQGLGLPGSLQISLLWEQSCCSRQDHSCLLLCCPCSADCSIPHLQSLGWEEWNPCSADPRSAGNPGMKPKVSFSHSSEPCLSSARR